MQLWLLVSPGDDPLQHVGQIGLRVESWSFAVLTSEARIAQLSAPPSLPLNSEFCLPIAIGRIERSTVLVSTSTARRGGTASARPSDSSV